MTNPISNTLIKPENININYTLGDQLKKNYTALAFTDTESFSNYKLNQLARLSNIMGFYLFEHEALCEISNSYFTDGMNIYIHTDFWANMILQEKEISNNDNNRIQHDGSFYILLHAMTQNLQTLDAHLANQSHVFSIEEKNYVSMTQTKNINWQIQVPEELKILFKKWDNNEECYFSKPLSIEFSKTVQILKENNLDITLKEQNLEGEFSNDDILSVFEKRTQLYQYILNHNIYQFAKNKPECVNGLAKLNEKNVTENNKVLINQYIQKMKEGIINEKEHDSYFSSLFKIQNDEHGLNFDSFNCIYFFEKILATLEQEKDNKEVFNQFVQTFTTSLSNIGERKLLLMNPFIHYQPTDYKKSIILSMAHSTDWNQELKENMINVFVNNAGLPLSDITHNNYLTFSTTPSDINMEKQLRLQQHIKDYDESIMERKILSSKIQSFREEGENKSTNKRIKV
jgi:hypothetical protein